MLIPQNQSNKSLLLLLLMALLPLLSFAQNWCASNTNHAAHHGAQSTFSQTAITITVVVHVVWFNEEEELSEAQVLSQIAVLNEDFREQNADIEEVFPFYQGVTADMEINFELITEDLEGNPHPGIIYKKAPEPGFGNEFEDGLRRLCYDHLGGSSAWCPDCYLNIWVTDLGTDGVAGIGIFPTQLGTEVPRAEDGVYIQSNRFGRTGTVEEPYELGRTTTHEVGHYLNLLHLWGAATPPADCLPSVCCNDPDYDDFVADTAPQIRTYLGECPGQFESSCGQPDNTQNFMGFSADACSIMFTEGQKERVWAALQAYRPGLLNLNCNANCVVGTDEPELTNRLFSIRSISGSGIHLQALDNNLQWVLYNAQGQLVKYWESTSMEPFVVAQEHLTSGIYFLLATKGRSRQLEKVLLF